MEPLHVSEVHSSLSQWTSVILVMEASCTKTTHAGRASKIYRRFVFSDSHGVKVSAVAFDDNVARIEGLLLPFKKYCIGGASVEEVPRPASPDLYRFFWILTRDTLIKEVFEPETPSLPPYFDLTPFTSFQHLADSHVSINMMGVVLHALPIRESRFDLPSVVTRDYVVVDKSNMPILLTLTGDLESEIGNAISDALASIESKPVIIYIRVRVKTNDYLSLCTTPTSVVLISPRVLEATHLEQWYRSNRSELMTSVLEERYCNPLLLLPPVTDAMLSTVSGVVATVRFPMGASWIKGRVTVDRLHRLWHLACPYCFAPNNFIETLGISCVTCLTDLYTFPRARIKLTVTDGTASINVIALGYEAEKLIGFTAYQLSQAEHEGVTLNLRVADALDGRVLCCYVSRSPESIQLTGVNFIIVTSYWV
ncbi:replication protein A 70 kDa DNA-binding subunit B-like [Coffea arabica]|uniref:Replication protein A 70 kDa DNA-binding subunit B-like n=1 Tax=Coffea arabica TaxID=13443 RepID=A0ABM4U0X4_COFAR